MRSSRRLSILNDRGFSLVELMSVIAILGILLGIGSLAYTSMINRYNTEKQMNEMYSDLMSARFRAMQRNRVHFVVFSPTRYTIYEDTDPLPDGNGDPDPAQIAKDDVFLQKNLNPSYSVTYPAAWNVPATQLRFTSKGLVPSDEVPPDPPVQRTIRVTASTGSAYDCIEISEIKLTLGKWNDTKCVGK